MLKIIWFTVLLLSINKNFAQCGEEHLAIFGNSSFYTKNDFFSLNSNLWYYEKGDSTLVTWWVHIHNDNYFPIFIDSSLFPHRSYMNFSNDTLDISTQWAYIENDLKLSFNPNDTILELWQLDAYKNYVFCTEVGTYKTSEIRTINSSCEILFFFRYPELSSELSYQDPRFDFYTTLLAKPPTYQPMRDEKGEVFAHDWDWRYNGKLIWGLNTKKYEFGFYR